MDEGQVSSRARQMFKAEMKDFIQQCRGLAKSLRLAKDEKQSLMMKAHMLKGGAGLLGYESLARQAAVIESAAKDEHDEAIHRELKLLIPELERCLAEVK